MRDWIYWPIPLLFVLVGVVETREIFLGGILLGVVIGLLL